MNHHSRPLFNDIFNLVPENLKIRVTLSGDVKSRLSKYEGNYVLAPDDLVNGEAFWNSEDGANSLWYDKIWQNWKIGPVGNRGSSNAYFLTTKGTAEDGLPHEIKPWKQNVGGEWTASDDIVVEGRTKIVSLLIRISNLMHTTF